MIIKITLQIPLKRYRLRDRQTEKVIYRVASLLTIICKLQIVADRIAEIQLKRNKLEEQICDILNQKKNQVAR